MNLTFIGTGAAHDPDRGNVSFLYAGESKILVDCGFMNVASLIKQDWDSNFLDAIYISHSHADHFSGLVPYVSTLISRGRTKTLTLIGHDRLEDNYQNTVALTEREMYKMQKCKMEFIETSQRIAFNELNLSFAKTSHGEYENYAIKITTPDIKVAYSGDGRLTKDSEELFSDANVLIHNVKSIKTEDPNHASMKDVLDYTSSLDCLKTLCFTHLHQSYEREEARAFVNSNYAGRAEVLLPAPGDTLEF